MAYEPELDGLRAVAVTGVVLFHLGLVPFGGGFTGVDVFFVLSGYLITALIWPDLRAGRFSFADFYIRRARRLLPALFTVIAASAMAGVLLLSPDHLARLARSAVHAALSVSNINFWLETGYFDAGKYTKPLLHTWSLGVEEQFYLAWPLLAAGLVALARPARQIAALAGLIAASFLAGWLLLDSHPGAAFYLSPLRAWQFAAGGLLAFLLHGGGTKGRVRALTGTLALGATLAGLALIAVGFGLIGPDGYPGLAALVPTGGTLLVILGGGNRAGRILLANPLARWLGRISYSLYLTHWPVIVYLRYYQNAPLGPAGMVAAALVSLLTAWLLYRLVETPLRRPWSASPGGDRRWVPLGIAAALIPLLAFGALAWAQGGWAWRLSDDTRTLLASVSDRIAPDCRRMGLGPGLERSCLFGAAGRQPDVIVIGDSHGETLALGLEPRLTDRGETGLLFTQRGALPFDGARTYDGARGRERGYDEAWDWALQSEAGTIIVHARFALHWLTERPEGGRETRKFVGQEGAAAPDTIDASQAHFRTTLEATLARAAASGKQVLLVGALPFPGVDLQQCVTRPTLIMSAGHVLNTCTGLTRREALARTAEVNALLDAAARTAGVEFLDPAALVCPADGPFCARVLDGDLLFRDTHHLSEHGAGLLADQVLARLDAGG